MTFHIETDRFILREFRFTDVDDFFEMDSDPEVHIFLGKNPSKTKEDIEKSIEWVKSQYLNNRIGRFAIEDKETREVVGWSGLKLEKHIRDFDYFDLGYRLKKKHWGKGIASETALASLKFGFLDLKLNKICGAAEDAHVVSNHILQKVGLEFIETFEFEGDLCNFYGLERDLYLERFVK